MSNTYNKTETQIAELPDVIAANTAVSPVSDAQTLNETLTAIAGGATNDQNVEFEVELFTSGEIDFENYIESKALFEKLRAHVQSDVEMGYVTYQQSLLQVLQHCYGYFYLLKTDTERYNSDIKQIDKAIRGFNRNSNKSNSLSAKIVKLAWHGTRIDRRRVSDYAGLIDTAWQKGNYKEHITDARGRLLPSQFANEVMHAGGISAFTRCSSTKESDALADAGYKSKEATKVEWAYTAISGDSVEFNGKPRKMKVLHSVPYNTVGCVDTMPILLLGRINKEKGEIDISYIPQTIRALELFDKPLEQALIAFYDTMLT